MLISFVITIAYPNVAFIISSDPRLSQATAGFVIAERVFQIVVD